MASLERRIAALAFPALIVLAAEPLYLLFDIAVVGRLGALSLAGLAIGGLIVSLVGSQLTFLSTATTARSARFHGVGNRAAAVAEGVQATWLAIGLGLAVVVVVQLAAVPLVSVIAGPGPGAQIADTALPWPERLRRWARWSCAFLRRTSRGTMAGISMRVFRRRTILHRRTTSSGA
jgi:Na+-driven multidrug efflux pump